MILNGDTFGALQQAARKVLSDAGIDSAAADARLLLGHAAELDRTSLFARANDPACADVVNRLEGLLARRLAFEPVSRILGRREFYGLSFQVTPHTLDPRPDTEVLVEVARGLIPENGAGCQIVDLGTGTGAVLLALMQLFPQAAGVGGDISEGAIECARANAKELGFAGRAAFVVGDWAGIMGAVEQPVSLIVSNPPYIPSADIACLDPDVRDFDPHAALDGGADGLQAYREIAALAAGKLATNGALAVEVGIDQAPDVSALMTQAGFGDIVCHNDLSGIARVVVGRKVLRKTAKNRVGRGTTRT